MVEAGAGTGKTTLLVDRIECAGPLRRRAPRPDRGRDLHRERGHDDEAAAPGAARGRPGRRRAAGEERERAGDALEVLERANVSTIHALCAAILQERPLDCGVVPGFRMADEAEADVLFARAWEEWLGERLTHADDVLLEALDLGIPLESAGGWGERSSLRGLARVLLEQRDLAPLVADDGVRRRRRPPDELVAKAARGRELADAAQPGDALAERLIAFAAHAEAARFLQGPALVEHLLSPPSVPRNFGHRPRWPSAEALEEARGIAAWAKESAAGMADRPRGRPARPAGAGALRG